MAPTGTSGQNEKAANPPTEQYMQATDYKAGRLGAASNTPVGQPGTAPNIPAGQFETASNAYTGQLGTAPNQPSNAPAEMDAAGQQAPGSQPMPQPAQKPRADWERQLWNQNEQKEDERK